MLDECSSIYLIVGEVVERLTNFLSIVLEMNVKFKAEMGPSYLFIMISFLYAET